jgi:hypothetical protein
MIVALWRVLLGLPGLPGPKVPSVFRPLFRSVMFAPFSFCLQSELRAGRNRKAIAGMYQPPMQLLRAPLFRGAGPAPMYQRVALGGWPPVGRAFSAASSLMPFRMFPLFCDAVPVPPIMSVLFPFGQVPPIGQRHDAPGPSQGHIAKPASRAVAESL